MVAARQVTIADLEAMPPTGQWELIDGELIEVTPASDEPSSTGIWIGHLLLGHVHPARLGRVYGADGGFVLFPDRSTVLVPDVAFVRADRAPQGKARKSFPRLAPDLVVEVLSPSDRTSNVVAKVEMYQEAGVPLIWLVDPDAKTITVIAAGQSTRILREGDILDGGDVLPDFSVPVADIFV